MTRATGESPPHFPPTMDPNFLPNFHRPGPRRAASPATAARWPTPVLLLVVVAIVLGAAIGCGDAVEVDVVRVARAPIVESFSEPAKTRLARTWRIAMPVSARLGRVDLLPGDAVERGAELAAIDRVPLELAVAEARARVAELRANVRVKEDHHLEDTALRNTLLMVEATSETLKSSAAQIDAQRARADRAARELARKRALFADGMIPDNQLEDAQLEAETTTISLRAEEFTLAALRAMAVAVNLGPQTIRQWLDRKELEKAGLEHQLAQAEAMLGRATHELRLATLAAPTSGVVLERFHQGETYLAAGHDLLLLGDLADLEVEADVLTQDALRIAPGTRVELAPASRREPLGGRVARIEPQGFTKLSSLGVEQQRVRVLVQFDDAPAVLGLGVGYRLQATFRTGERADALTIPRYAIMQAPDGSHFVFVVDAGGVLRRRPVVLGLRGDLTVEVVDGLREGELVVRTPDATLADGVRARTNGASAAK